MLTHKLHVVPYGKLFITVENVYIVILQARTSLMWKMLLAANWVYLASLVWKDGHVKLMSVCKISCTHEGDEGLVKGNKELVRRKAAANSFERRNVKVQGFH